MPAVLGVAAEEEEEAEAGAVLTVDASEAAVSAPETPGQQVGRCPNRRGAREVDGGRSWWVFFGTMLNGKCSYPFKPHQLVGSKHPSLPTLTLEARVDP